MITPCPVCGAAGRCVRSDGLMLRNNHRLRNYRIRMRRDPWPEIEVSSDLSRRLHDLAKKSFVPVALLLDYLIRQTLRACGAITPPSPFVSDHMIERINRALGGVP